VNGWLEVVLKFRVNGLLGVFLKFWFDGWVGVAGVRSAVLRWAPCRAINSPL
jgi:hypothetical protein